MTGMNKDNSYSDTDVLVTVRLPVSLLEELKILVQMQHYMDASEAIRSILRQKREQYSDPLTYEVRQLSSSIQEELKRGIARKSEQRLVEELKKIREKIKEELE